jgi:hypothetical protein
VLRVAAKFQNVPLRNAQMLENPACAPPPFKNAAICSRNAASLFAPLFPPLPVFFATRFVFFFKVACPASVTAPVPASALTVCVETPIRVIPRSRRRRGICFFLVFLPNADPSLRLPAGRQARDDIKTTFPAAC